MNPVYANFKIRMSWNSISVISGRSEVDIERRKAVFDGNLFTVEKISPRARLELGTAGSAGQRLIFYRKANGAPQIQNVMKTKNSPKNLVLRRKML